MVEDDDGYIGDHPCQIKCLRVFYPKKMDHIQKSISNSHELLNIWLNYRGVLNQTYWNDIENCGRLFQYISGITQLSINIGEYMFDCGYCGHYFNYY